MWRIKFTDAAGTQVQETLGTAADGWTRKRAEAELRDRLVKVEKHGYRRPQRLTFGEYARGWFADGPARRGWKPNTVLMYATVGRTLDDEFGRQSLDQIRPRHVAAFITRQTKEYAPATISKHLAVLSAIFETAVREELVQSNPARRAERPKIVKKRWRVLTPAEVARVSRAFTDPQARLVFTVLVQLGLRRSELQRLRWADIDLVENTLYVRESKSDEGVRSIAIPTRLAEDLWQHRRASAYNGDGELVFCHPERGTTYTYAAFKTAMQAALMAAGITDYVRPFHDLRVASLTNGAAAGESPVALQARAGHANYSTTQGYVRLSGVVFRNEAAALEARLRGESVQDSGTNSPETLSLSQTA